MTKQIVKYTKKYKVTMSNKTEFSLPETEIITFENVVRDKWVYRTTEGVSINTAFFLTAEPFSELDGLNNYQRRKIEEKAATVKGKVTKEMRLEWAEKLLRGEMLFN